MIDRFANQHRTAAVALSLAVLAAGGFTSRLGAQADAVLRDFQPTSEYRLWVAGKEVPKAEIYESPVAGAYLILTSSFPSPVLIGKRSATVETVDLMKVSKQADGSVDLLADATLDPLGMARFENNYEDIVFSVAGKETRLKVAAPLTGIHARADLLAHTPEYGRGAAAYKLDGAALNKLKMQSQPVRVKVFFGSWCPHCRQMLPHVLKMEEGLAGSKVAVEYYGLPRPPAAWQDAEVVKQGVKGVPTDIVYLNGKEVGRITANDWAKVEVTLAALLNKAQTTGAR